MEHPALPEHSDPGYVAGGIARFVEQRAEAYAADTTAAEEVTEE